MPLLKTPSKALRGVYISMALLGVATAIAVAITWSFRDHAASARQTQQSRLQQAYQSFEATLEEQRLIAHYDETYQALRTSGLIGVEPRLSWVEALQLAAVRLRLPSLDYQIDPRTAINPPDIVTQAESQTYRSTMALKADLIHEGDLFTLFDLLRRHAGGHFIVGHCALRPRQVVANFSGSGNVGAECELQWLTMDAPTVVGEGATP